MELSKRRIKFIKLFSFFLFLFFSLFLPNMYIVGVSECVFMCVQFQTIFGVYIRNCWRWLKCLVKERVEERLRKGIKKSWAIYSINFMPLTLDIPPCLGDVK